MAKTLLKGEPVNTVGELPKVGQQAANFRVIKGDLSTLSLAELAGKKVVLNIFPSLDTATCANSVRQFNQRAAEQANTTVLCISMDLPFAQQRFCVAEGINNVIAASDFNYREVGTLYGLRITTGKLTGLLARAVIVLDENQKIIYEELVPEIAQEPNYDKALSAS